MLPIIINVLLVIHVLVSLLIILLVLMQRPKNEGLGAAFGGGMTENLFGAQTTNVLQTITRWLGGIFFGLTLLLSYLYVRQTHQGSSIQRELSRQTVIPAATPAPAPATTPGPGAVSPPVKADGTPLEKEAATPAAGTPPSTTNPPADSSATPAPNQPPSTPPPPAADKPADAPPPAKETSEAPKSAARTDGTSRPASPAPAEDPAKKQTPP